MQAMGNFDSAFNCVDMAVKAASAQGEKHKDISPETFFAAGELMAQIGGYARQAITYLQKFSQTAARPRGVNVTWSRAHEMLGDAHFDLNEYREAARSYIAVLEFNPFHPWEMSIYYRAAISYYQQGDLAAAIEIIHRLLTAAETEGLAVTDYRVYDVLGNAHFALAHYQEAIVSYETAMDLAPISSEELAKIKLYYHYSQQLLVHNNTDDMTQRSGEKRCQNE